MGYNNSVNPKDKQKLDTTDCRRLDFKPLQQQTAYRRPGSMEYKQIPSRIGEMRLEYLDGNT